MQEKVITPANLSDLTDQRFGCWTVLGRSEERRPRRDALWHCRCDCGRETTRRSWSLTSGSEISCRCQRIAPTKHGQKRRHGATKEYQAWQNMKRRCNDPSRPDFANYGGRGIMVFEGWLHSFDLFLEHVGLAPSSDHQIDRYPNNDGNYEPGNVRWATPVENNNNRRSACLLTCESLGLTLTLNEWAKRLGGTHAALQLRLKHGWPMDRALTEPLRKDKRRNVKGIEPEAKPPAR